MGILADAVFAIRSATNILKIHTPAQLTFGNDTIIPINHNLDWELLCLKNKSQINKYSIRKNGKMVDYNYKFNTKSV